MDDNNNENENDNQFLNQIIFEKDAEEEIKESYLTYAMSVIISRALPDARDGLKPSQRRILVAMNDLNLGPRSKHRKCAKIAGDTSGNYHPHGESVVYPTLVRMAQNFNTRYPLVDGQGNFGSIDDKPAAMRYTEARMTHATFELMEDLKYDTVNYISNYDETREEPTVLPGPFPNLLCNGSYGIAVGMSTSMPPHNVNEICDGIVHLLNNPECSVDDLMQFVKGPDFPTGGIIKGRMGIVQGYKQGRGKIKAEAKWHVETNSKGRETIVITEIPYQVRKESVTDKIKELVKNDVVTGISDLIDSSSRKGMAIKVFCKKDEDSQVVMNLLLKHTPLRSTFSIINIALVDERPKTLNLKGLMCSYRDHRIEVIRRRTRYLLARAEDRAHIVEGLLKALAFIDEVIAIIKNSDTPDIARHGLVDNFELTLRQANAILEMRLQRLTGLEVEKLKAEYKKLQEEIADYKDILANAARVIEIMINDLDEIKKIHGDERKTQIEDAELTDMDMADFIVEEDMAVTISEAGYIKRLSIDTYRTQKRGGRGVIGAKVKEGDIVAQLHVCSTHDWIMFFSNKGRVHWRKVYQIPEASRTSLGRALVNLLDLDKDETIASCVVVNNFEDESTLFMATEKGVIKRIFTKEFKNVRKGGIAAINLDDDDKLVEVIRNEDKEASVLLASAMGQIIRFEVGKVRTVGRSARGVGGINLQKDDKVIAVLRGDEKGQILTICENGYGKRTPLPDYRITGRNGKGVINIKTSARNGNVMACLNVYEEDDVLIISKNGMTIRTHAKDISSIGRSTQGVRIVNLKEGDQLVSVARIPDGALEDPDPEPDTE